MRHIMSRQSLCFDFGCGEEEVPSAAQTKLKISYDVFHFISEILSDQHLTTIQYNCNTEVLSVPRFLLQSIK